VKTTFNIHTDNFDYSTAQLFIEIAPKQISAFVLDGNNCFNSLLSCSISSYVDECIDEVKEMITQPLFNKQYKKTTIIWALPESILTPDSVFDENNNTKMLSLVFGPSNTSTYRADILPKNNIHNVYRVNSTIYNFFKDTFPNCQEYHQFTILPQVNYANDTSLLCIFYNSGFCIQVQKDAEPIFVNYFDYAVPEDISYYLLSICKNFNFDAENVTLVLSGLIEKESILYRALYKYFLKVSFFNFSSKYTCHGDFENYPKHFFNHLFAMAACV
jgi:hypothetical protein